MGFAKAAAAVNEKRVVRFAGCFGNRSGGGAGEVVVVANNERFESVFRIEHKVNLDSLVNGLCGEANSRAVNLAGGEARRI
jgi:hypothetical protein